MSRRFPFRRVLVGAFIALAATRTALPRDEPGAEADRARLRGVWQLVFAESDGNPAPAERISKIRVEIKEKTHSVTFDGQEIAHEVPFAIDPKADPKATVDTIPDGPDKGKQIHGIYRVDGDTLVSCVAKPGADRPKAFSAAPGSGRTLRVFLRVRPDEGPGAKAVRDEFMRFGGTWTFARMTVGGQESPPAELEKNRLILQGNQFLSVVGELSMGGDYVIDPLARPRTIDVRFSDGSSFRGIYELTDDTYTLCFDLGSKERPRAFESKPGTQQVLEVLKRHRPAAP
jgi:uncharacterized protein (TIGR03067 family)